MGYNNDIMGFMKRNELDYLEKIVENIPINGNIIELGSLFGRSAVCMAMSVNSDVTIFCIDSFSDHQICFNDNNHKYDIDNPTPISGVIYDVEKEFINNTKDIPNIVMVKGILPDIDYNFPSIDMIFLDLSHKNPNDWDTLCNFVPLIKVGGLISGHDYSNVHIDVKKNVEKLEKIFNTNVILYDNTELWSIVVTKKIEKLC